MTTHSMRGVHAARARVFARVDPRYAFELVVDLAAATFRLRLSHLFFLDKAHLPPHQRVVFGRFHRWMWFFNRAKLKMDF